MTNLTPIFKFSIHYGSRVISLRLCTSHPFLVWKLPRDVYVSFQFFTSSDVLLFPFTLLYFNAFHFFPLSFHVRYFHVLPLSAHILSLSLHAMSKSSQIEYSECMTLVTLVVTIYMYEYWKNKYTLIQKHFLSSSHYFHAFYSPVSFLSLPSMFLPFPSIISLFYVHLIEISLLSLCSFMSFWCSFDFPFRSSHFPSHLSFMSLSFYSLVTSVSYPFSFKSFHLPCMSCHFRKKNRISAHVRIIFFS